MVALLAPIPIFAVAAIGLCSRVLSVGVRLVVILRVLYHFVRYIAAELANLFSNVTQKGVAGPAPQQHYGVDGYAVEVHSHGGR